MKTVLDMTYASGFTFDLFLRRRLHPYYSNLLRNLITDKEFAPMPLSSLPETGSFSMVTDVPDYLDVSLKMESNQLKTKKVKQYQGFLCDLSDCETALDYMSTKFSKKSIKNIRAKKRQLETQYNIVYKNHYGEIDREHYDFLFDRFYDLLKKRFDEKKIQNRYLLVWKTYHELVYPMILRKEASLFAIYDGEEPIALALDFYVEDISFGYIQVFDAEYQKYYMGDVFMMERLDWLLSHTFKIFDFLMGETYYKIKWSNHSYTYHHQLFYKPNSLMGNLKMQYVKAKLQFKQYLRDKGILGKLFSMDRLLYRRMSKKLKGYDWKNP
ncbi:GNAT family N-acetyltransferase [Muricauda sp. CAU 1633]|uniref:GNAT family N-acetyltransferase n=1 Tax=Allomuricauda sp. CAU 1633 TaxID=2816036 RepID=UPI001A8F5368|nr:GNAT family N-acetyltransferase [Muricauda sp. CAU 1633]MBO0322395.1 GNAT family N-acetyltransferase [Muricauda sp. CAU 1633]